MSKALEDLRARLADLDADLAFVSLAARLRPRLGDVVNWNAQVDVLGLAREFMNAKAVRVEGLFGPLLVRLLAALERYARGLVEEAVNAHSHRARTYEELEAHIRTRHLVLTGNLLASIESPRDYLTFPVESLVANLATCLPGTADYRLNSIAFAAAVFGTGPAALDKALANVGVRDWWDRIGADATLANLLGTKGSRATGLQARERLEELSRWRNQLAHGGDEEIALTEDELRRCVQFVATFTTALDAITLDARRRTP